MLMATKASMTLAESGNSSASPRRATQIQYENKWECERVRGKNSEKWQTHEKILRLEMFMGYRQPFADTKAVKKALYVANVTG